MILAACLYTAVIVLGALLALDAWLCRRAEAANDKRIAALKADAELYAPGRDANAAAPWRD